MVSGKSAVMNSNFFLFFFIAKPVFNGEVTQCRLWVKGCFLRWAIGGKSLWRSQVFWRAAKKIFLVLGYNSVVLAGSYNDDTDYFWREEKMEREISDLLSNV